MDTTLILEHFERVRPEPAVSPRAPAVAFVSRLIEDYADECLWRPAMHDRWSFAETARLTGAWLAEHVAERRAPEWPSWRWWHHRQPRTFVTGDGVTAETRAALEASYLETLDALETIFDRLHHGLCALGAADRVEVERVLGASETLERLAAPSPRAVSDLVGPLPLTAPPRSKAVDSWWR